MSWYNDVVAADLPAPALPPAMARGDAGGLVTSAAGARAGMMMSITNITHGGMWLQHSYTMQCLAMPLFAVSAISTPLLPLEASVEAMTVSRWLAG